MTSGNSVSREIRLWIFGESIFGENEVIRLTEYPQLNYHEGLFRNFRHSSPFIPFLCKDNNTIIMISKAEEHINLDN